jgi:predicted methyltransferase
MIYFLTPDTLRLIEQIRKSQDAAEIELSLDLGRTVLKVRIGQNKLQIADDILPLPDELFRASDERTIFKWRDGSWEKWQFFDKRTGKYYKPVFVEPGKPPTLEISGIKMHVTQNGNPETDTENKLKTLGTIKGKILDTCLGLGYTTIYSSRISQVEIVFSCEKDQNVLQICRENPWSAELFGNSKIQLMIISADSFVRFVPDNCFDAVLHDPPRFALAPELYSEIFYQQIYRLLKPGGKFYHYTGNPNQAQRKMPLAQKTLELLTKVGFRKVRLSYQGVVAQK